MDTKLLKNCAEHKINVLLVGRHGVGKTMSVKEVFNERYGIMGVDWLYLSASTIDPWVDFIGIPKEREDPDTGELYLTFVKPKALAKGTVKAIFLDELNRAHPKVLNAVMELIQFKSINGKKFDNLETIWGAINPHEADQEQSDQITYTVQQLDPALKDRFPYQIEVPYAVNEKYFVDTFGEKAGSGACTYWNELPKDAKYKISPRRLEDAVSCILLGMPINGLVIPKKLGSKRLTELVTKGSPEARLRELLESNASQTEFTNFFDDPSNSNSVRNLIDNDMVIAKSVLNKVSPEIATSIISDSTKVQRLLFSTDPTSFTDLITNLADTCVIGSIKNQASIALIEINKTLVNLPKDVKSIAYKKNPSTNIQSKLNTLKINDYEINKETLELYISDNHLFSSKTNNLNLQAAFVKADKSLCLNTSSSSDRLINMAAIDNLLSDSITEDELQVLFTLLDHLAARSQTGTLRDPYVLTLAIKAFCFSHIYKQDPLDLCFKNYQSLYTKLLSYNLNDDSLKSLVILNSFYVPKKI